MQILITGIAGSAGSYLADYITQNHPEIKLHGIARWHSTSRYLELEQAQERTFRNLKNCINNVRIHNCDMVDPFSVIRVLQEIRDVNTIFHLASTAAVRMSFSNPSSVINNNISITLNLLEAIRILGINPTLVMCGTSECYGHSAVANFPIDENYNLDPINPYSASKVLQDLLGSIYYKNYKLKIIRTRAFTYCNPRRADLFMTSFAKQIARIELGLQDYLFHGSLTSVRSVIDVRDVVRAYFIAAKTCKEGEVYNIGSPNPISVGEVLERLIEKATCKIETKLNSDLLRSVDVNYQYPNIKKFRDATDFVQQYSFEDSLNWILDECRKEVRSTELSENNKYPSPVDKQRPYYDEGDLII